MIAIVVVGLLGGASWLAGLRPVTDSEPQAAPPVSTPAAPSIGEPAAPPVSVPRPGPSRSATPTGTEARALPPVSLAGWKLTLPQASDKGTAASVEPANSAPPWLTRDRTGSVTFWAPVEGATTENSEHPRTELVSLSSFQAGASAHTLTATLSVAQVPAANPDIIIGQIHGAGDIKSVPYVMLHYDGGNVRVVVKRAQSGSDADKYPLISGVPLGARFSYTITDAGDGTMRFSASYGSNSRAVTAPIPAPFRGATVRFQAGAYQQGEPGNGANDGARLTFYRLRETP